MRVAIESERPPITLPTRKIEIAVTNGRLRPTRSPSLPYTGITIVDARMYAVVTPSMCSTPLSSPTMVGSAVVKIV